MSKFFRLWLIVLLLCSLPVMGFGAQGPVGGRSEEPKKKSVTRRDAMHHRRMQQQMPLASAVITAKTGERIGSSRPVRLHPTNGSKPGKTLGRWASDKSIHLSHLHALLLHRMDYGLRASAASPRCYYVIALRRLLC